MKSSLRVKFMVSVLAAGFVLAAGYGAALAGTNDPALNTYQDPDSAPYRTQVLPNGEDSVYFLISPSIASDAPASFFSSKEDAEAVAESISVILDDPVSLSEPLDIYAEAYDIYDDGSWLVMVDVEIPNDKSVGSFGVKAVNTLSSNPGNVAVYTVIRNPLEPIPGVVSVDVWIANPLDNADVISTDHGLTVSYNDYPSESDERDFPHAFDATYDAETDSGVFPRAGNFTYYDIADSGIFLYSMEIDGVSYASAGGEGWQYRVYRQYASSAPDASPDELTEYVLSDAIELLDGDIVYWAYGAFNAPGLFPATLTPRFPVTPVQPAD
jgi:hypothetical protein